jgi:hypothetical protein
VVRRSLLPPGALPGATIVFLLAGLGPNVFLAATALIVLLIGLALLWRPGESPVLLFLFAFPWLQASILIFHANWYGVTVAELSTVSGDLETAILLSLAGLLTVAIGIRLGAGAWRWQDAAEASMQARAVVFDRWLRPYLVAWAVSFTALAFAWVVPSLSQPMLALASLKWAFYFMLAYKAFLGAQRDRSVLALVFLVELASAIGGYFSDFKTVFLVTTFAAVAAGVRFSPRGLLGLGALTALLFTFAVLWTAIKGEYRTFLSGGVAEQIVTVDYPTRLSKVVELIGELDQEKLILGVDQLMRRLTYVEFFGVVLTYVPSQMAHENGALFWDAVSRPFLPRLFFPDKEIIDDSVRTNLYTGGLAGNSEGTSISLGYVAESYIDFGPLGMFPALFVIGLLFGRIYRGLLHWSASRGLLGMALATGILTGAAALETSFTKAFGGIAVALLVAVLLAGLVVPRWAPWLKAERLAVDRAP